MLEMSLANRFKNLYRGQLFNFCLRFSFFLKISLLEMLIAFQTWLQEMSLDNRFKNLHRGQLFNFCLRRRFFPENFTPRDAHCYWQWASKNDSPCPYYVVNSCCGVNSCYGINAAWNHEKSTLKQCPQVWSEFLGSFSSPMVSQNICQA